MKRVGRGEPPHSKTATNGRIARHALALAAFVALSAGISVAQGAPQQGLTPASKQMQRHFQHEDALYQLSERTASLPPPQGLRASQQMERHFQHEDALYQLSERTASLPPPQGLRADGLRWQGIAHAYELVKSEGLASSGTSNGFDWGDAGIGFATAIGAMLLAVAGAIARRKTLTERHRLARWLERAATRERPFIGRGPRYLIDSSVRAACAPSLRTIAATLRNDARSVNDESLRTVRAFLTSPDSSLFDSDAAAALRQAVRIQHLVIDAEAAVPEASTPPAPQDALAAARL
jgi:hypothetical protein